MRVLKTILLAIVLLCLGFALGYPVGRLAERGTAKAAAEGRPTAASAAALQREIIEELQRHYYKPVSVKQLQDTGIEGMLKSLDDPYTVYLTPRETKRLNEETEGAYSGIGAVLEKRNGQLTVVRTFAGSPARQAGIEPGDIIVTIDGQPTGGRSVQKNVERIKGEEGSQVALQIRHQGSTKLSEMTLTRRRIPLPLTRTRLIVEEGVTAGYVQLFEFASGAGKRVAGAVAKLQARGAQWIIFDLRYNGGGLLDEAVNVSSDFIEDGVIVTTQGLHSPKESYEATDQKATSLPMVVLVNGFTASASEIVAGALQDYERATLVGTRTFGKGLVQNIESLPGGASLKLTTAVYVTPDGRSLNEKGLIPNVVVRDDLKTKGDEQLDRALQFIAAHG